MRDAMIIVRSGVAYVPTVGHMQGGGSRTIAPVYTAEPSVEDLSRAIERALAAGNPELPRLGRNEPRGEDPVLKAAGVRTWTALARGGATYTLVWLEDKTWLYMSMLDKKGRFVEDPAKTRQLPPNIGVREVVELILEDVHSRPELLVSG